jgi:hypothetical protein
VWGDSTMNETRTRRFQAAGGWLWRDSSRRINDQEPSLPARYAKMFYLAAGSWGPDEGYCHDRLSGD